MGIRGSIGLALLWSKKKKRKITFSFTSPEKEFFIYIMMWLHGKNKRKAPLITTANCWAAIIAEASRQATGRKMGAGGRVLQLAADTMPVGELHGINDVAGVLYDYPPD
jgi:hypothetical protein